MIKKNTARPQDAVCFRGVQGIKSLLVKAGLARLRSKGDN